jgi:hypothetical protein
MGALLALLAVIGTVLQAALCARMAWRAELKLGAVGLALLAVAAGAVPALVFWRLR